MLVSIVSNLSIMSIVTQSILLYLHLFCVLDPVHIDILQLMGVAFVYLYASLLRLRLFSL